MHVSRVTHVMYALYLVKEVHKTAHKLVVLNKSYSVYELLDG